MVEARIAVGDEAREKVDKGMLKRVVRGWRDYAREHKHKREMRTKAIELYSYKALKKYLHILSEHAKGQKFIKNDRFLRRALVDGEDFFEVSI